MRVLVWNLFHGRAVPAAGRPLLHEFAELLARWQWDVALLQEVPPWWAPLLAQRCHADVRAALTSRNQLLPLRRAIASRAPDRLKSNGGGANAILVRAPWTITAHGTRRLRIRPERRVVHAVRVAVPRTATGSGRIVDGLATDDRAADGGVRLDRCHPFDGAWIGNVHAQLGSWDSAAGRVAPLADLARATAQLEAWARRAELRSGRAATGTDAHPRPATSPATPVTSSPGTASDVVVRAPLVLGGDFNLPRGTVVASLPHEWTRVASSGPDHIAGRGIVAVGPSQRPDRGTLSDHAPLLIEVAPG